MNFDISQLLEHWDYQSGQVVVRKFKGKDGQQKLQLRIDLGILQMNAAGRPDGKKPLGYESLLEYQQAQLEKHRASHEGNEEGFELKPEDCIKLQQEAIQYHHRYICLFQLEEFDDVVRDTERNLRVFDLVEEYAAEDVSWSIQQFRPQLLMMRTRAKATIALQANNFETAISIIEAGVEELRNFYREHSRLDLLEQSSEVQSLDVWLQDVLTQRPMTERERLETALNDAVRREDYETAAQVRDAIKNLKAG